MIYLRMIFRRTCKMCLKLRRVDFDVLLLMLLMFTAIFILYSYSLTSHYEEPKYQATEEWHWEDFVDAREWGEFEHRTKSPEEIEIELKRAQAVNLSQLIASVKMGKKKRRSLCERPHLDLKHDANRNEYHRMEPLNCNGSRLFYLSDHKILVRNELLSGKKLQKCAYHGVIRLTDDYVMDTEMLERVEPPFEIKVLHDFIHVYCTYDTGKKPTTKKTEVQEIKQELDREYDEERYADFSELEAELNADIDQFLVQIVPNGDVIKRIEETKVPETATKLNVLMFAMDSMSHLSFERKLPKTVAYLKEVLGSVVLNGYNIVGDATTAAILPMFTGQFEWELPETRRNMLDSLFVDEYPLIWNKYNRSGYVTMYAEDEPSLATFNLRLNGFDSQPTDHYMRPFWKRIWESVLNDRSSQYCLGGVPKHSYLLEYTKDLYMKYQNFPKFSFTFSGQLSHGDNNPAEYIDSDLTNMLESLRLAGKLDNTVVIIMGDHGARSTKVRWTVQGKLEERLPFMSISVPKIFREKYPKRYKHLVKNVDHLTTPFDIHETLLDLLDISRWKKKQDPKKRGISLFRSIPSNRTCQMAGIAMHWCTCMKQLPADVSSYHVKKSVDLALTYINKLITGQELSKLCANITLKIVRQAYIVVPNEKVLRFEQAADEDNREANFSSSAQVDVVYYQITMETAPNDGLYEFTVQVNLIDQTYQLNGEISRVNMYGSQADCVVSSHPHVRKYCYCKSDVHPDGGVRPSDVRNNGDIQHKNDLRHKNDIRQGDIKKGDLRANVQSDVRKGVLIHDNIKQYNVHEFDKRKNSAPASRNTLKPNDQHRATLL